MEITVEIGTADIVALNEHVARTVPVIRARMILTWLLVPALIAIAAALMYALEEELAALILLIAAGIVLLVFLPLIRISRRLSVQSLLRPGSNRNVFGPQQIRITPHEIARHNKFGHSAFYWSAIDRIEVADQHAFVFVSSMTAIIIPRRDLSAEKFSQFLDAAQEYLRVAAQQPTAAEFGIHAESP